MKRTEKVFVFLYLQTSILDTIGNNLQTWGKYLIMLWEQEAVGSSPATPTKFKPKPANPEGVYSGVLPKAKPKHPRQGQKWYNTSSSIVDTARNRFVNPDKPLTCWKSRRTPTLCASRQRFVSVTIKHRDCNMVCGNNFRWQSKLLFVRNP